MRYLQTYESHSSEWTYIGSNDVFFRDIGTSYKFNIDGIEYRVMFSNTEGSTHLSFGSVNKDREISFGDLEKTNPFKTMKTITEIVKDFVVRFPKVNKIRLFGAREKNEITKLPDWFTKLLSSNYYLYHLSTALDALLLTPQQWISKPTRRTQMFNRLADREAKSMNWSVKRIGNEIQLIKNKPLSESIQESELSDVIRDIFADILDDNLLEIKSWSHKHESGIKDFTVRIKAKNNVKLGEWELGLGQRSNFELNDEIINPIMFCSDYLKDNGYKLEMLQTEDDSEVMDIPIDEEESGSIILNEYLESIKGKNLEIIQLVFEVPKTS